jgi:hypothetical protein
MLSNIDLFALSEKGQEEESMNYTTLQVTEQQQLPPLWSNVRIVWLSNE